MEKKTKKKEPILTLTPKGLFSILLQYDEVLLREFMDGLELFMRRMYKEKSMGAIIFDGKEFVFGGVSKEVKK
jgi:hypothetical protein